MGLRVGRFIYDSRAAGNQKLRPEPFPERRGFYALKMASRREM